MVGNLSVIREEGFKVLSRELKRKLKAETNDIN